MASAPPSLQRLASRRILGVEVGAFALWGLLATILSTVTERVADWNAMTDELVYERLAIAIAQSHSVLPHLHGHFVRSLAQLYPLLISPVFLHGFVPDDLRTAHVVNAWLMSSACIPAYLLARRVSGRLWVAYVVLFLTASVPWILYSTVLLTEVAAYPAFLWAIFAMQRTIAAPSRRNDALAVLALVLAFFARTQFLMLTGVLLIALVGAHLSRRGAWRDLPRTHAVLLGAYAVLAAAALAVKASGHSLVFLSVYGSQISTGYLPPGTLGLIPAHAANLAFGVGIVPFVVGVGWALANAVRAPASRDLHAFAWVAAAAVAVVVPAITAWDLRLGQFVLDRYLYYLVPVVLLAFVCALRDTRRPRWSLVLPVVLVAWGFATHLQESFLWSGAFPLSTDSPGAWLYKPFADLGGGSGGAGAILAALTVVGAGVFLAADRLLRPELLTRVAIAILLVAVPAYTIGTFAKLFSRNGHSSRPLTRPEGGTLDWLDRALGTDARVTQIPYPISSSFFVSLQFWRDLEFWNKSVRHAIHYPTDDVYADAVIWFPNDRVRFDPLTGRASKTLTPYVVNSVGDTRFRLAGTVRQQRSDVMLVEAAMPWRASWLSSGLYDDGWSRPGKPIRVRVFAAPGQGRAAIRTVTLHFSPPDGVASLGYTLRSGTVHRAGTLAAGGEARESIQACVPERGYADVVLTTPSRSAIPGDLRSREYLNIPREGGLLLRDISLADELGETCEPAP